MKSIGCRAYEAQLACIRYLSKHRNAGRLKLYLSVHDMWAWLDSDEYVAMERAKRLTSRV